MAISLSSFSPHCLPSPQTHRDPSAFFSYSYSSKSSFHLIRARNSNASLKSKLSYSGPVFIDQKPSADAIRLGNQLQRCLWKKNYTECISVVESMASRGYTLHIKSCSELIKGLFKYGKKTEAARVISVFESCGKAKTVLYNAFITGLCRKKELMPALETVGRMRSNRCKPDIVTCNILVGCLCDKGMLDFAFGMVEHFKTNYEVRPDLITYNPLLEGTFLVKGVKEGMELLDQVRSHGMVPDQVTYNLVVKAVCKRGHVDEMLALLDGISLSGVKLYFASFKALLEALIERKCFAGVDKMIDETLVRACWVGYHQLDYVVMRLCKSGLVDKAKVLLEGIAKGQCMMSLSYRCCNMVSANFIKEGRPDKAVGFINYLITVGQSSNISFFNPNFCVLCNGGQVCQALEMLNKLEKIGSSPHEVMYNILIGALWNIGDHDGSVKMVSRLLKKGFRPDEATCTLIKCLCKDGMVDEAMQLKSILVERGFRVSVGIYDALLLGFCKVGRVNEAIDLLDEIFEINRVVYEKCIVVFLEGLVHIGYESETRKIAQELVLRNVISIDSVDVLDG